MSDYLLKVSIKNNLILSKIKQCGYPSASSFAADIGIPDTSISNYVTMKESPISRANGSVGEWKPTIIKIANGLGCEPSDLFNQEQINGFDVTTSTAEISREQMLCISEAAESSYDMAIDDDLHNNKLVSIALNTPTLNEREKLIIQMRYGVGNRPERTLEECAATFDVTAPRLRQIEQKAFMKIKAAMSESGEVFPDARRRYSVAYILQMKGYDNDQTAELIAKHFDNVVKNKPSYGNREIADTIAKIEGKL